MKGARKNIRDANQRIPLDLIAQNSSEELLSESIKNNLINQLVS